MARGDRPDISRATASIPESTRFLSKRSQHSPDSSFSEQMDEILHHPDFQSAESAWRGLRLLVDRTDFRENIKLEILSASKQDLLDDFEDSPELVQSGLYKHIYSAEYGQFGGEPVAALIANYFFDPSAPDRQG